MVSLRWLGKPQYLFRPSQIAKRLIQEVRSQGANGEVKLPWGLNITLDPTDTVSEAIFRQGIYDLVTTEALWRLASEGDCIIDVGANIGYMTSLFAIRAGAHGSVIAFEPHPKTYETLKQSVEYWRHHELCAPITTVQAALSNKDGTAILGIPSARDPNRSHARITAGPGTGIQVRTMRFSSYFASPCEISLVKIDTEGHEAAVLEGMGDYLGHVRDIVFEEFAQYPAASHQVLEGAGYTVFGLEERLAGPKLRSAEEGSRVKRVYDTLPSFVATLDPTRVQQLLAGKRWHSLAGT